MRKGHIHEVRGRVSKMLLCDFVFLGKELGFIYNVDVVLVKVLGDAWRRMFFCLWEGSIFILFYLKKLVKGEEIFIDICGLPAKRHGTILLVHPCLPAVRRSPAFAGRRRTELFNREKKGWIFK